MSTSKIQPTEFVQIITSDDLTLPGLFYEANQSKKAAIYLHGNGSSSIFYDDDIREVQSEVLNEAGISYLIFNNRGANIIKKLTRKGEDKSNPFGMAYEIIKECVLDIDAAIDYLKTKGYKEFYLVGESTGANKICVYHYYKPDNEISKNILLAGGDDVGIYYTDLGESKFNKTLRDAEKKVEEGKGDEIIKELLPHEIFSYKGFYDIANPNGDYNVFPFLEALKGVKLSTEKLFRYFESVNTPTLVVYGDKDEYAYDSVPEIVEILKKVKPEFRYEIIEDADHVFSKDQEKLSKIMAEWLNSSE